MCSEELPRRIGGKKNYGESNNNSNELSWAWAPIPSATTPDRCSRPVSVVEERGIVYGARMVFPELPNVSRSRRENSVRSGREATLGGLLEAVVPMRPIPDEEEFPF